MSDAGSNDGVHDEHLSPHAKEVEDNTRGPFSRRFLSVLDLVPVEVTGDRPFSSEYHDPRDIGDSDTSARPASRGVYASRRPSHGGSMSLSPTARLMKKIKGGIGGALPMSSADFEADVEDLNESTSSEMTSLQHQCKRIAGSLKPEPRRHGSVSYAGPMQMGNESPRISDSQGGSFGKNGDFPGMYNQGKRQSVASSLYHSKKSESFPDLRSSSFERHSSTVDGKPGPLWWEDRLQAVVGFFCAGRPLPRSDTANIMEILVGDTLHGRKKAEEALVDDVEKFKVSSKSFKGESPPWHSSFGLTVMTGVAFAIGSGLFSALIAVTGGVILATVPAVFFVMIILLFAVVRHLNVVAKMTLSRILSIMHWVLVILMLMFPIAMHLLLGPAVSTGELVWSIFCPMQMTFFNVSKFGYISTVNHIAIMTFLRVVVVVGGLVISNLFIDVKAAAHNNVLRYILTFFNHLFGPLILLKVIQWIHISFQGRRKAIAISTKQSLRTLVLIENLVHSLVPPFRSSTLQDMPPKFWHLTKKDNYENCTIIQMDMSGFTKLSSQISAEDLVTLIHAIFTSIDYLADCIGNIWKVETVGDCYIGVVGGPNACDDHAHRAVVFALSILENVKRISERTQLPLKVRIGIHSGSITAAFIGELLPRYLIYGPDVEVVRQLEATATPGLVEISDTVADLLPMDWSLQSGKRIQLEDGRSITTYVIQPSNINFKAMNRSRHLLYPRLGVFYSWFCASVKQMGSLSGSGVSSFISSRSQILLHQSPSLKSSLFASDDVSFVGKKQRSRAQSLTPATAATSLSPVYLALKQGRRLSTPIVLGSLTESGILEEIQETIFPSDVASGGLSNSTQNGRAEPSLTMVPMMVSRIKSYNVHNMQKVEEKSESMDWSCWKANFQESIDGGSKGSETASSSLLRQLEKSRRMSMEKFAQAAKPGPLGQRSRSTPDPPSRSAEVMEREHPRSSEWNVEDTVGRSPSCPQPEGEKWFDDLSVSDSVVSVHREHEVRGGGSWEVASPIEATRGVPLGKGPSAKRAQCNSRDRRASVSQIKLTQRRWPAQREPRFSLPDFPPEGIDSGSLDSEEDKDPQVTIAPSLQALFDDFSRFERTASTGSPDTARFDFSETSSSMPKATKATDGSGRHNGPDGSGRHNGHGQNNNSNLMSITNMFRARNDAEQSEGSASGGSGRKRSARGDISQATSEKTIPWDGSETRNKRANFVTQEGSNSGTKPGASVNGRRAPGGPPGAAGVDEPPSSVSSLSVFSIGEFGRRLSSGSLMEASRSRNEIPRAEDGEKGGKGNQSDIIAVSVAIKAMCDETASNASAAWFERTEDKLDKGSESQGVNMAGGTTGILSFINRKVSRRMHLILKAGWRFFSCLPHSMQWLKQPLTQQLDNAPILNLARYQATRGSDDSKSFALRSIKSPNEGIPFKQSFGFRSSKSFSNVFSDPAQLMRPTARQSPKRENEDIGRTDNRAWIYDHSRQGSNFDEPDGHDVTSSATAAVSSKEQLPNDEQQGDDVFIWIDELAQLARLNEEKLQMCAFVITTILGVIVRACVFLINGDSMGIASAVYGAVLLVQLLFIKFTPIDSLHFVRIKITTVFMLLVSPVFFAGSFTGLHMPSSVSWSVIGLVLQLLVLPKYSFKYSVGVYFSITIAFNIILGVQNHEIYSQAISDWSLALIAIDYSVPSTLCMVTVIRLVKHFIIDEERRSTLFDEKEEHVLRERELLNALVPPTIAERLRAGEEQIVDGCEETTIMFIYIDGYSEMLATCGAERAIEWLDDVFCLYDRLIQKRFPNEVFKVETLSNFYLAASGCPIPNDDHAMLCVSAAILLLRATREVKRPDGLPTTVRAGLCSGPSCGGVIGNANPRYSIFGDTVNTASRMASTADSSDYSTICSIHCSQSTMESLSERFLQRLEEQDGWSLSPRSGGQMEIKGKGLMQTFVLTRDGNERGKRASMSNRQALMLNLLQPGSGLG